MQPQTPRDPALEAARVAARKALEQGESPAKAQIAYLEMLIGQRIEETKYPGAGGKMTTVKIEQVPSNQLFRATIFRDSPQGTMHVGATPALLIDRVNEKYFKGENARPILLQSAKIDVQNLQRTVESALGTRGLH